jgi:hypothetical protein
MDRRTKEYKQVLQVVQLQNALKGAGKSKTQVKKEVDKTISVMVSVNNKKK